MEQVTNRTLNQTLQHSNSPQNISNVNTDQTIRSISKKEELGLFAIINEIRALQCWSLAPAHELAPICKVWWKQFARYHVPPEHYQTLYERALDIRIKAINAGSKNVPALDAPALLACWSGEYGLAAELRQKEIDDRRTLPATAESDCPRCFGTGAEIVYDDETGEKMGTRFGGTCEHRPLEPGEWLYKEQETLNNEVNNG